MVEAGLRGYAVYPPWESLALALPRPNFPTEDKSHNLRANVVDPIHHVCEIDDHPLVCFQVDAADP